MMGIEIYNYRKHIVCSTNLCENLKILGFNEVLTYRFINQLINYWTPDLLGADNTFFIFIVPFHNFNFDFSLKLDVQ